MTTTPDLLKTVLALMDGMGKLRHRKMFGGVYIYCDDLFIATIHDERLYFKANKETASRFIERGLAAFSYLKQGELARLQYYEAPPEVFVSRAAMQEWAKFALLAAKQDESARRPNKPDAQKQD